MKVARYVVPGKGEKRGSVRTIDWLLALAKPYVRRESPNVSVIPGGTAVSFSVKSQSAAADTGYFHCVPAGQISLDPLSKFAELQFSF
jgi:hypothetical protein